MPKRNDKVTSVWKVKKEIAHKIQIGKSYGEIIDWLQDEYGYTANSARDMYCDANQEVKEKYLKYCEDIAKRNTERLNAIVDRCYDEGRIKEALTAIDTLNKMSGQYTQKVDLNTNEPITITFG